MVQALNPDSSLVRQHSPLYRRWLNLTLSCHSWVTAFGQLDGCHIPAPVEVFAGEISTAVETSIPARSSGSAALGARGRAAGRSSETPGPDRAAAAPSRAIRAPSAGYPTAHRPWRTGTPRHRP